MSEAIDTQEIRKTVDEMATIILSEDLARALQSLGQDKKLLAKAKEDPMAFLKAQGLTVPPKTEVNMVVRRKPRVPTSIDTHVGLPVPRFTIEYCFTRSYVIGRNTPFEREVKFTDCNKIFVF